MAYLLALSDEILLAILSYFHNTYTDQPTLYRLSLVSRRLHALVSDRLLRKADLDGTSEKYGLFLRSIKENLHLGAKVHDLNLTWNDYLIKSGNPQELLVHLPNLRRLSIKVMQSYRLQSKFYLPPPSCSFYEMDIHLESPIHTDVCDLLLVDGIHHLKITIPRPNILPFVPAHKPHQAKIAPLQSFTVIGRTKISPYSLRNLLQYPTSLSHLSIPLPGGENFIHAGRTTVAFMNDPLSPGGDIARALAPAAFSLRSLEIHGHAQDFPGHDGTRLPLRGFTALQSAKLSSLLFFPPPEHVNTDPTGLYELLPPAIEEITLNFDYPASIPDLDGSLTWLTELAAHKPTHTPSLRRLGLCEHNAPATRHGTDTVPATQGRFASILPDDVSSVFTEAGIEGWGSFRRLSFAP